MVVLGSNSCGSTSLIQSVLGVNSIVGGKVFIKGAGTSGQLKENYKQFHKLHGIVGYQPQRSSIDNSLTVLQHLTLFSNLSGISNENRDSEVEAIVKACCLDDLRDVNTDKLTSG